jgi:hypothetical protein
MRAFIFALSVAAYVAIPASATPPALDLDNPAYADPANKWESVDEAVASLPELADPTIKCRDTINKARADNGLPPMLDREPASPDKPHHI